MTNRDDRVHTSERARRVRLDYERYRRSTIKRRAWAATNPGNVAIRTELGQRVERLAASALEKPGAAVLDAGCGGGYWLAWLAQRGVAPARLHGIDLLEDRVAHARRQIPGATVVEGDLSALPYEAATFDLVLLLTVVSSLGDGIDEGLAEVRRVLAPGGIAIVYEPRIPTFNRATRSISPRVVAPVVGQVLAYETLTLAPPIARRLGARTGAIYPLLARVPALRTHWIGAFG